MGKRHKRGLAPDDQWRLVLVDGYHRLLRAQRMFRRLPSAPRCKMCHNPFGGFGGRVVGLFGFKPSRKNPNFCRACCEDLPVGGVEIDTAILFADIRESTQLAEDLPPGEYAALLQRFYVTATEILVRHDAVVDKLIGDEVMAFFVPGLAGADYRRRAVEAALALVGDVKDWLPVGAAVHAGQAFVGNVGEGIVDFTALGDTVNTAARLQGVAEAGEVLVSAEVFPAADDLLNSAEARAVTLRGKSRPLETYAARP